MKIELNNSEKLNLLHFQHNIYDLGNGYCEILDKEYFYQDLKQYMKRLFDLGHKEIIINILNSLGSCVKEHDDHRLRLKALAMVSSFSSLLKEQKDNDFFRTVVNILTAWLSKEREYHEGYYAIFSQVKNVINQLFSLKLWGHAEAFLAVSRDIISGKISTELLFKRQVSKLHNDIADPIAINSLVESFLISKERTQTITCNVLEALAPYSSEAMIYGLFKCGSREKRFKLLHMLQAEREGILPILVEKLRDKQRWYVVRNSMVLLGNLKDPDLYSFARPFLCHPDSRVQRETIDCIVNLGGEKVSERLIASISLINDEVKEYLIDHLLPLKDAVIREFFVEILEKRFSVPANAREKLIIAMCSTGRSHLSPGSIVLLREIVVKGEYVCTGFDPALDAARKLFKNLSPIDNLS